jgi:hypothetical protein
MTAGPLHPEPPPTRRTGHGTLVWAVVLAVLLGGVVYPLRRFVVEPQREALLGHHETPGLRLALASQFAFDTAAGYAVLRVPGAPALELSDLPGQAVTLILGGFRGPYVAWLWMKVEEDKQRKIHFDLIDRYHEIALLQSDYPEVWVNHAWNMAYNVSAQWQSPERKYQWVRHAIDFLKEGYRKNPHSAAIMADLGWIYSNKLGQSQEAPFYRKRVLEDEGQSTFRIAYEWFDRARKASDRYGYDGHGLSRQAMYSQSPHALSSYALETTQAMIDALEASVTARKEGRTAEADKALARGKELLEQAIGVWRWARDEWRSHAEKFQKEGMSVEMNQRYNTFYSEAANWAKQLDAISSDLTPEKLPEALEKLPKPEIK